jgi:hypothetical protein
MKHTTGQDKIIINAIQNREVIQQNRLVIWNRSILVPRIIIIEIIKEHHNLPLQGHQGINQTMEKIQQQYYFPNMRRLIIEYINKCDSCNRNKPINH